MNGRPIKVCFVSLYSYHYFNPTSQSKFGGAELQLYLLATALAKDPGFEVSFIVGDFGQPGLETRGNITLYKFFNPQRSLKYFRAIGGFLRLWKLLDRIKPDVCVQRAAGFETAEVAFYCKFSGKRFIYMAANDLDVGEKQPFWMPGWSGFVRWQMFKRGLSWANLVLVQHSGQLQEFQKHYQNLVEVRHSAHQIPIDTDAAAKDSVLWVSRCEDYKQPEIFIELAKVFPNQKFVMIMPVSRDEGYFQKIKKTASEVANLKLVEFVPFNQIDEYFKRALVFVNTSSTEGFPNTFIQALKFKTPVLSYAIDRSSSLPGSLFADGDFSKMRQLLQKTLSDEAFRKELGEQGYQFAFKHHNLELIVEQDKKNIRIVLDNKH